PRSRRDVAHLAVGDDGAKYSAGHRFSAERDGGTGKVIAGKHGRGGGVHLAHEEREILPGGLEATVSAGATESAREGGAGVEHGLNCRKSAGKNSAGMNGAGTNSAGTNSGRIPAGQAFSAACRVAP